MVNHQSYRINPGGTTLKRDVDLSIINYDLGLCGIVYDFNLSLWCVAMRPVKKWQDYKLWTYDFLMPLFLLFP